MKSLIIKNLAIAAAGFLLANTAFAQNSQTINTSIYFASNSHTLDAQASKTLNNFLQQLQTMPDFELDVRAYTDDVGSEDYNKILATQRAQSIIKFLEQQKLAVSRQEIEGVGELQLNAKDDAETQRRQNRRVDIVVSIFRPESINDLFSYFTQRNRTLRTIDSRKPQIVTGTQGTIFQIPANAFQRKDGKPVQNPVQIEIREAYTHADMVALNLTTQTADGGLETGGMTYIAATDADGTPLQLKADVSLQLMIPSERELPKDMALYTSPRSGNDNAAPTVWEARNVPFTPIPEQIYINNHTGMNILQPLKVDKMPIFPQVVRAVPKKPSSPSLRKPIFNAAKPDMNVCRSQNPRKLFENTKAHERRIEEAFDKEVKNYEKSKAAYERSLANYYRANDEHLANTQRYQNDLIAFERYVDSVRTYYHDFRRIDDIKNLNQRVKYNASLCTTEPVNLRTPLLGLIAKCHKYKFTTLGAEAEALYNRFQEFGKAYKSENHQLKYELEKFNKMCAVQPIFTLQEHPDNSPTTENEMQLAADWCQKVEKFHTTAGEKILSDMAYINQQLATLSYKCQQTANPKDLKDLEDLAVSVRNLAERIEQARENAGLLNEQELRNQFYNLTTINNFAEMGWVNCDQPMIIQQVINFTLSMPYDANTRFYIVRKDRPSIADVSYSLKNNTYSVHSNTLPPNVPVKLIALRVRNHKAEYCVKEGISNKLSGINDLQFQPTHINELYKILNTI